MKEVSTSIFIPAKPDRVWRQVAGFRHYAKWNPFILAVDGALAVGEAVDMTMKLVAADGKRSVDRSVTARIVKVEDEHEIRWQHGNWIPGLLDFEQWFRIAPCKGGVNFHHTLQVSGLMSGTLNDDYFAMYRQGFAAMNDALIARIEAVEAAQPKQPPISADIANDNAGDPPRQPGTGRRRAS